jgi:hypothetical protein
MQSCMLACSSDIILHLQFNDERAFERWVKFCNETDEISIVMLLRLFRRAVITGHLSTELQVHLHREKQKGFSRWR